MINIVVVSHSAQLALGVEQLARQMMRGDGCKLALAAGVAEAAWIGACTYAEPDRFFSYRRATHAGETDYGRLISAISAG